MVRVLEAGDDGIAKTAAVGQCRDGETSGLAHPQTHLLPLLAATERLCEPGGVHAQAGWQATKLRHFGSRVQELVLGGWRPADSDQDFTVHPLSLIAALAEQGGVDLGEPRELVEQRASIAVEVSPLEGPRGQNGALRHPRRQEPQTGLKHTGEAIAEVGQGIVHTAQGVVGAPGRCVALEVGHGRGQDEPETPTLAQEARARLDEQSVQGLVAPEPSESLRVRPGEFRVERLGRAPRVGDPRWIADDGVEPRVSPPENRGEVAFPDHGREPQGFRPERTAVNEIRRVRGHAEQSPGEPQGQSVRVRAEQAVRRDPPRQGFAVDVGTRGEPVEDHGSRSSEERAGARSRITHGKARQVPFELREERRERASREFEREFGFRVVGTSSAPLGAREDTTGAPDVALEQRLVVALGQRHRTR